MPGGGVFRSSSMLSGHMSARHVIASPRLVATARLGLFSLASSPRASEISMARINIYNCVGRLPSIDATAPATIDDRWLFYLGYNGKIL